jgi:hypothetical protein
VRSTGRNNLGFPQRKPGLGSPSQLVISRSLGDWRSQPHSRLSRLPGSRTEEVRPLLYVLRNARARRQPNRVGKKSNVTQKSRLGTSSNMRERASDPCSMPGRRSATRRMAAQTVWEQSPLDLAPFGRASFRRNSSCIIRCIFVRELHDSARTAGTILLVNR